MRNLLKKLDEKAGKLLDTMDNQLNETMVRAMTGKVFVDEKPQVVKQDTPATDELLDKYMK